MSAVKQIPPVSRRCLLGSVALGASVAPLAVFRLSAAFGAADALLNPADPAAKAVRYVEDASRAKSATAGSKCATCALYLGAAGSAQGACQIFAGKQVKAAGWCSSWAPQM
jgi:hypothetical protein